MRLYWRASLKSMGSICYAISVYLYSKFLCKIITMMTEIKFEFISEDDIKDENYFTEDSLHRDTSLCEVNQEKCGEIFITNDNIILVCGFCNEHYDNMLEFGYHVRVMHVKTHERSQEIPGNVEYELSEHSDESNHPLESSSEDCDVRHQRGVEDALKNGDDSLDNSIESITDDNRRKDDDVLAILGTGSNGLYCIECQKHYYNRKPFTNHIKTVHKDKPKANLICRYCNKELASSPEMSQHILTHTEPKPYRCPQCKFSSRSPYERNLHVRSHHENIRPFQCTECPASFAAPSRLTAHMCIHDIGGTIKCKECGKGFAQQCRLKIHMLAHTGEKPCQCEICGRKFRSQGVLTEHMKRHNNIRKHECKFCNKKFYTSQLLKMHLSTHTKERVFRCTECGQDFKQKATLRAHQKLHSNNKEYACEICGKEFAQYAGLYSHRKSHTVSKLIPS